MAKGELDLGQLDNDDDKKEQEEYQEDEISNYDDNKVTPNYEEFAFAPSGHGSGFVVGNGKYVITNHHVIDGAKKVAVRNGIGKVTKATVAAISKDYDLAILELSNPYPKSYSIDAKDFVTPKAGDDVISIGYPGIGITYEQPTITQGIISKVFDDEMGIFLTTAAINSGNSGGPLFNLNGKLVGVSFAALDKNLLHLRKSFTYYFGKSEEYTDLSHFYLAVPSNHLNNLSWFMERTEHYH